MPCKVIQRGDLCQRGAQRRLEAFVGPPHHDVILCQRSKLMLGQPERIDAPSDVLALTQQRVHLGFDEAWGQSGLKRFDRLLELIVHLSAIFTALGPHEGKRGWMRFTSSRCLITASS